MEDSEIKIVIDLHGAKEERKFDIEFGTLNNLSADFSTIRELEEASIENNITNIKHNESFKGGAITQYLFNNKDVDVIQPEINKKYRDLNNIEYMGMLCDALIDFVMQFDEYVYR